MKKYGVTCTIIYNGYAEVEAENEDEAFKKIENQLNYGNLDVLPTSVEVGDVKFTFGEATADYADEID